MKKRVVITGMGSVSPFGNTASKLWDAIKNGKCGIRTLENIDFDGRKVNVAAQALDFKEEDFFDGREAKKYDRVNQFGVVAAREALTDSGIDVSALDLNRCGVIVSSGIGGLSTIEKDHQNAMTKNFSRVSPLFIPMAIVNTTASSIAIDLGFNGICQCIVTACASATDSIGSAFRQIRDGYQDVMIAGGAEASITPLGLAGFSSLRALNHTQDPNRASIPFDAERKGFVMGEGSGIIVLEEYEHAKRRGAKIYAEMVGYGASCDAEHMTAPNPDGIGAGKCMLVAMQDAQIMPEDVKYINAHGTSTPLNDSCETKAIKLAFLEHAYKLAISSTKSMTGHLLGASGGIEAIITALAVKEDFAPPTVNYKVADPECDLDITPNEGKRLRINYAMSNSLGFGGHNSSILLKKYEGK